MTKYFLFLLLASTLLSCNQDRNKNIIPNQVIAPAPPPPPPTIVEPPVPPPTSPKPAPKPSQADATAKSTPKPAPSIAQPPSDPNSLYQRFPVPNGYKRLAVNSGSFGEYLRALPLKPEGSKIGVFNGTELGGANIHAAVVDLPIGNKDLHQCADAVMRLRAEYFWSQKRYKDIHFNFTNGMRVDYDKWRQGYRIKVNESKTKTSWQLTAKPDDSYESFWKYLEQIFMFAGTASLSKELGTRRYADMRIGDVLIIGGFPGHAVIIVDMAKHIETGEKIYMVAQSFMPAQDLHIITSTEEFSPWYRLDKRPNLTSWGFEKSHLKHF